MFFDNRLCLIADIALSQSCFVCINKTIKVIGMNRYISSYKMVN